MAAGRVPRMFLFDDWASGDDLGLGVVLPGDVLGVAVVLAGADLGLAVGVGVLRV